MFDTKKPHNSGVWPRFRPYDVFTLRKPYESGFSRTSGNAAQDSTTGYLLQFFPTIFWSAQLSIGLEKRTCFLPSDGIAIGDDPRGNGNLCAVDEDGYWKLKERRHESVGQHDNTDSWRIFKVRVLRYIACESLIKMRSARLKQLQN